MSYIVFVSFVLPRIALPLPWPLEPILQNENESPFISAAVKRHRNSGFQSFRINLLVKYFGKDIVPVL